MSTGGLNQRELSPVRRAKKIASTTFVHKAPSLVLNVVLQGGTNSHLQWKMSLIQKVAIILRFIGLGLPLWLFVKWRYGVMNPVYQNCTRLLV